MLPALPDHFLSAATSPDHHQMNWLQHHLYEIGRELANTNPDASYVAQILYDIAMGYPDLQDAAPDLQYYLSRMQEQFSAQDALEITGRMNLLTIPQSPLQHTIQSWAQGLIARLSHSSKYPSLSYVQ